MKKILFLSIFSIGYIVTAQQPYYNDVNLNLTGQDLYFELQSKIDQASSSFTYGDVRDSALITDEDPQNNANVLLVYGYNDSDGNCTTDRSRDKDDFGGLSCEWNREHVFARGNTNPPMGSVDNNTTGIAADPQNIRPSDQQMNNNKGNKKFGDGSGNAGNVGSGNWYPGDEWKGDVARMVMYMYTRYGDRCLPSLTGVGPLQGTTDMLQLFLEWNAEDPVSELEDQRNPHLEAIYGNRNPFIDNPYLATIIWGGPPAEDRWDLFDVIDIASNEIQLYPNPTSEWVYFSSTSQTIDEVIVFDIFGKKVAEWHPVNSEGSLNVSSLMAGCYFFQWKTEIGMITKKVIIQ